MKLRSYRILSTGLAASFVFASSITAQQGQPTPPVDVSSKPIKVMNEMKDAHKRWVNEDVAPIITDAERKAFRALQTDEERENFIATFWRRRDPDLDTEENEYREDYYERIAYANENFASGIPGWKTDRGRIYIKWGKPDSVEARPAGGSYDRPSYEGGGSTTVYPFETWFYRHLDGVGDGIEIEFVDPSGTGEYRIARSPNEKDALAMVPGAGSTTNELLGLEPRSGRLANINPSYQREQDSLFRRQEILFNLDKSPTVRFSALDRIASGDTTLLNENPIEVEQRIDFYRLSDDKVMVAFTVQTDNRSLTFGSGGGLETARLNIFGRVTAVSGKRSGIFEDSVTATALQRDLAELRERKSVYQKMIALTPGVYKIDLVVRDIATGNTGVVRRGFTVPRYDNGRISTSTMMLASTLRTTDPKETGAMFVIGGNKVIPNLSGKYKRGQEIGVYMQIYNAGIDQTTLRPAVDVEYLIMRNGEEVFRQIEDWNGLSDSSQRLTLARLLPTADLVEGDYQVRIVMKDRVTSQTIENKSGFTVIP